MNRKQVRGLIQIAVSAVLLFLILRQVHWQEVRDAILSIDARWLLLAWLWSIYPGDSSVYSGMMKLWII